eukprot:9487135-Pyramimonas_sp.AAC.1
MSQSLPPDDGCDFFSVCSVDLIASWLRPRSARVVVGGHEPDHSQWKIWSIRALFLVLPFGTRSSQSVFRDAFSRLRR